MAVVCVDDRDSSFFAESKHLPIHSLLNFNVVRLKLKKEMISKTAFQFQEKLRLIPDAGHACACDNHILWIKRKQELAVDTRAIIKSCVVRLRHDVVELHDSIVVTCDDNEVLITSVFFKTVRHEIGFRAIYHFDVCILCLRDPVKDAASYAMICGEHSRMAKLCRSGDIVFRLCDNISDPRVSIVVVLMVVVISHGHFQSASAAYSQELRNPQSCVQ